MGHYHPAWFAPGPHLKTVWGRLTGRRLALPARMERFTTPDDDEVELRRLDPPGAAATAPRLLLLHGLEGGLHSHYVANFAAESLVRGWGMDLLIFRGCNGELNRQPRFYHSGETTDLDFVLGRLIAGAPAVPRLLAGVSLGGNVLLKWLGERGGQVPPQVKGAAAMSVPYDLARGCRYISQGFSQVYERHFLRSLKEKALRKLDRYPGAFDRDAVLRARTLWDFDDAVTAPLHGFAGAADYYRRSSSLGYLHDIRLPTLLLSAEDDPFLPREVLDEVREIARGNPALELEFVRRGGHVGFVSGRIPWRSRYWGEWRVLQFLMETL
ncbi:MAG: YheT family hydrolase [Gemmatimonadaceae bacterium]